MKRMLLILMIVFLAICSGCFSRPPEPITETVYVKQYIPLELLIVGCQEDAPGVTVRELGMSWANNTGCLRAYKKLIEGLIRDYTEEGNLLNERKDK